MLCNMRRVHRRPGIRLAAAAALLVSACGGSAPESIPGLDAADELALIEASSDAPDDYFAWTHGLEVGDLPLVNVGHPTEAFLADAHRMNTDPTTLLCLGSRSSSGCVIDDDRPAIQGLNFGQPDAGAWEWAFVPATTAAVRFTDRDGGTVWQRPIERLVIFPDTDGTSGQSCDCQTDAVDAAGTVIASVDVDAGIYVDR